MQLVLFTMDIPWRIYTIINMEVDSRIGITTTITTKKLLSNLLYKFHGCCRSYKGGWSYYHGRIINFLVEQVFIFKDNFYISLRLSIMRI
jgi:hypothetical protein